MFLFSTTENICHTPKPISYAGDQQVTVYCIVYDDNRDLWTVFLDTNWLEDSLTDLDIIQRNVRSDNPSPTTYGKRSVFV